MQKRIGFIGTVMAIAICLSTFFAFTTQAAATFIAGATTSGGATKLTVGKEYVTEIGEGKYWYKFTTSSDDAYYYLESKNIDVKTHSWSDNLYADICTEFGEVIFGNAHTTYTAAQVSNYKLEPSTTYYLRIYNNWYEGAGNFKFKITKKSDPDENDMAYATKISLNKNYNRTLAGNGDTDWFSFNTGTGSKYVLYGKNIDVQTHTWASDRYFRITLLNSVREEIQTIRLCEGDDESATVNLEPNSKYYIRIENHWEENLYEKNNSYLFSIGKPVIKSENVAVADNSYVYNGKARKPKVTVTYGEETLISGKDYTVTYKNNVNAGKATVTVTGKGSYIGTVSKNFTISKASQKITVKSTSYSKTMGNKSFKITATAKGKITYTPKNKKIVTVDAKGLVKLTGAGKTKITIKAAATSNYKAATKTVNITVKPKAPAKVSAKIVKSAKNKVKVSWGKASGATGYQISKAKVKSGTNIIVRQKASKGTSKIITVTKGTGYYYKVRAYKTVNGVTNYGTWSTVKYYKVK